MGQRPLSDTATRDGLHRRLDRLIPAQRPRWGTLDPHRMLCHLRDALAMALGEHEVDGTFPGILRTRFMRWMIIDSPLSWPKGRITAPEGLFATPVEPGAFERDRMRVHDLMDRHADPDAGAIWGRHPALGDLAAGQWSRLGARHIDHHLRQFAA